MSTPTLTSAARATCPRPTQRPTIVLLIGALLATMLLAVSPATASAADTQPTVDVTNPGPVAAGSSATVPIVISGFDAAPALIAQIDVAANGGTVSVQGNGLTPEEGYTDFTGVTSVAFRGSRSAVTSALAEGVVWNAPAETDTDVVLSVSVTETVASERTVFYRAETGHYYEYVASTNIAWTAARDAAAASELFGMSGYLVTITSQAENDFISHNTTATNAWIGATDRTVEGKWVWEDGPEAGQQFWQGSSAGSPVNGAFDAWKTDGGGRVEPNNADDTEDYAVTNWEGTLGQWNDLPNDLTPLDTERQIGGYIIEYGGMAREATPLTATAQATLSTVGAVTITAPSGVTRSSTDVAVPVTLTGVNATELITVVSVPEGGGTLTLPGNGLTLEQGSPSFSGQRVIRARGSLEDMTTALAGLRWDAPGTVGDVDLTVAVTEAPDHTRDVFYDPDHADGPRYYEYVEDTDVTWRQALDRAAARTLFGMSGYLVTITSQAENDFVTNNTTATNAWIGATDSYDAINDAAGATRYSSQRSAEGRWHWAAGPEAGQRFWTGTGSSGAAYAGAYAGWAAGEPNNFKTGEHYAVTNWAGSLGTWNDLRNDPRETINGYLVEYGDGQTEGPWQASRTTSLSVNPDVPGAPGISAAATGADEITVSWTPPADTGGGAITGYVATATTAAGVSTVCYGDAGDTSCVFEGLSATTGYVLTVAANNDGGTGPAAETGPVFPSAGTVGGGTAPTAEPGGTTTTPIQVTMPADRNGRINVPRGRLSRDPNDTDQKAVDVKLPTGLGGCLALDAGKQPADVQIAVADDGSNALVTGPEHLVAKALDDGAVVWDPDCATTADGAAEDGNGQLDVGIGNSGTTTVTHGQPIGDGGALDDTSTEDRTVVLQPIQPGVIVVEEGQLPEDVGVDTRTDGSVVLNGPEGSIGGALDDGVVTWDGTDATGTDIVVTVVATDRIVLDVFDGWAEARVAVPAGGGTLTFDTASHPLVTVTVESDGSIVIAGPTDGTENGAFEQALASGFTWQAPDGPGTYPLTITIDGAGGFHTVIGSELEVAGPPSAPGNVTAIRNGTVLTVSWDPPTATGHPSFDGYQASVGGKACTVDVSTTTCEIAGATATDGSYSVAVVATVTGSSDSAAGTVVITPPAAPSAPTALALDSMAVVSWVWPNGATQMTVTASPGGGQCTASLPDTSCTVGGLDNGTAYTFSAVARGAAGDSDVSASSNTITPLFVAVGDDGTVPIADPSADEPLDLPVIVELTDGTYEVVVTLPADGGSLVVDDTRLGGAVVTDSGDTSVTLTGSAAQIEAALAGALQWSPPGVTGTYPIVFDLTATGFTSRIGFDLEVSVTPGAPRSLRAVRDGGEVTVTWTAPSETGATPITEYEVEVGDQVCLVDGASFRCVFIEVPSGVNQATITATNQDGLTSPTATAAVTTPYVPPLEPEEPTAPTAPSTNPAPGTGSGSVDGEPVDLTVVDDGNGLQATGESFEIEVTPTEASGDDTSGSTSAAMRFQTGGGTRVNGSGFAPGSDLTVWLLPDRELGTFEIASDGTLLDAAAAIPVTAPACSHTLRLAGTLAGGGEINVDLGIWVEAVPYPFADASHAVTHGPEIGCIESRGITVGYSDGTFRRSQGVTRGQMASFIAATLGLDRTGTSSFPDASGTVHERSIAAVVEAGIAGGFGDGTFRPNEIITRGQMASMLSAAAGLTETAVSDRYSDTAGTTHADAIAAITDAGLAYGYDDGSYRPGDPVRRDQMASFLVRLIDVAALG